jgi:hypothetical protein
MRTSSELGVPVAASVTSVDALHIDLVPGRAKNGFQVVVNLKMPSAALRCRILSSHLSSTFVPGAEAVVVRLTEGFTPRDLKRAAARLNAKKGACLNYHNFCLG